MVEQQELLNEIQRVQKRLGVIEQKQAVNDVLTQQSIETTKELSLTLKEFSVTLINISNSLSRSDERMQEMGKVISKIDEKVDILEQNLDGKVSDLEEDMDKRVHDLSCKIEEVEDKSKFDILLYVKQNFVKILLVLGGIAYVVSQTFY